MADRRSILLLGDSITEQSWGAPGCGQGWAALLADAYRRRADVTSRGLGGYTTRTYAPIARRVLAAARASGTRILLTTLCLGANDANGDAGLRTPAQAVPVDEFRATLGAMLADAATVSDAVLCIAPPPVDRTRWTERSNARVAAYTAAAEAAVGDARAAVAAAGGAPCALLFVSMSAAFAGTPSATTDEAPSSTAEEWLPLLSDGLHLSSEGNARFAAAVLAAVRAGCPAAAPDAGGAAGIDFPLWATLPQASLDEARGALTDEALRVWKASDAAK